MHTLCHTLKDTYFPSSPSLALFSVFFMGQTRQTDAIFSTREKSVPCSALALLDRAPRRCYHSRGHTLGPWINQLHPPNSKQGGSITCRMRVQKGDRHTLCPLDSFRLSLWITENSSAALYTPLHTQITHIHIYEDSLHIQHPHIFYLPHSAIHPHTRSAHSSTDPID